MSRHLITNERVLAAVAAAGGGYVWDSEVFAVNLMDIVPSEQLALSLCELTGVQQIAIEASQLPFTVLVRLAEIRGLSSLVLNNSRLTADETAQLAHACPDVTQVSE